MTHICKFNFESVASAQCPKHNAPTWPGAVCDHREDNRGCSADWSDYAEPESKPAPPPLGSKHDGKKPRWSLLPWRELREVVEVLTFGADKYSNNNWKHATPPERYRDALMRHFSVYMEDELVDAESGRSHLAHVICCALFLMWFDNERTETKPTDRMVEYWKARCNRKPEPPDAMSVGDDITKGNTRDFNEKIAASGLTLGDPPKKPATRSWLSDALRRRGHQS